MEDTRAVLADDAITFLIIWATQQEYNEVPAMAAPPAPRLPRLRAHCMERHPRSLPPAVPTPAATRPRLAS